MLDEKDIENQTYKKNKMQTLIFFCIVMLDEKDIENQIYKEKQNADVDIFFSKAEERKERKERKLRNFIYHCWIIYFLKKVSISYNKDTIFSNE